jgi:hypothetical protein
MTGQPEQQTCFRLVKSETLPLTRGLVDDMRTLPASPTERECNQKRVDFLRDRLYAGLFHPPHWVKAVVDGITYRANGQHSSSMLVAVDGRFPEGMFVHVDTFECTNMDALALLFRQFDERKSARSPADVAGAYQGLESNLDDVPRYLGKLAVEGMVWFRKNVSRRDGTPVGDDRYVLFNEEDEHPFIQWFGSLFSGRVRPLMHQPVIAAIYATYNVDADAADDFWREVVAGGREYEETSPTSVLYDWLERYQDREFTVKPKQLYQGAIYAWNALRDGKKEIRDIKTDTKKNLPQVH